MSTQQSNIQQNNNSNNPQIFPRRDLLKSLSALLIAATLPVSQAVQDAGSYAGTLIQPDQPTDPTRAAAIEKWQAKIAAFQNQLSDIQNFLSATKSRQPSLADGEHIYEFVFELDNEAADLTAWMEGNELGYLVDAVSGWPSDCVYVHSCIRAGDGKRAEFQLSIDTFREDYDPAIADELQKLLDSYPAGHFPNKLWYEREEAIVEAWHAKKGA